jgi:hypothetical protein
VHSLDISLYKQNETISELRLKLASMVEEQVITYRSGFEQEIFALKQIIK